MKLFFQWLGKALSEDNGNPSSTRLNVFNANIQWVLAITFGFIWVVVNHPDMTLAYLGVLAGLVVGTLGIKVWQKGKEQDAESK